jgi:hypothetical protein
MAAMRSRRLRLLESLRRTLSEKLHDRVQVAANKSGHRAPHDTSSIYTMASSEAPDLLEQLLFVHHRVRQEQGEAVPIDPPHEDDGERKRMLSAVRATVQRAELRFRV